jgi:hypothetical protein
MVKHLAKLGLERPACKHDCVARYFNVNFSVIAASSGLSEAVSRWIEVKSETAWGMSVRLSRGEFLS